MNKETLDSEYSVLGLFGTKLKKNQSKDLFYFLVDFFSSKGFYFNKVFFTDFNEGKLNCKKSLLVKNIKNSFFDSFMLDNLSFSLFAPENGNAVNYSLCVLCDSLKEDVVIAVKKESMDILKDDNVSFLENIISICLPDYGIGYYRKFSLGPHYFALGIIQGEVSESEGNKISDWLDGNSEKIFRAGKIRDVFPLNLLNECHLNQRIEGQTLKEWIFLNPENGFIEKISESLCKWTITPKNASRVRKILRRNKLIFS